MNLVRGAEYTRLVDLALPTIEGMLTALRLGLQPMLKRRPVLFALL